MTLACRAWMPAGIEAPPLLVDAVARAVNDWSDRWFASDQMKLLGSFLRVDGAKEAAAVWRILDGQLALGLSAGGLADLGSMALAVGIMNRPAADTDLLEQVGRDCLADLEASLPPLFRIDLGSWRDGATGLGKIDVYRVTIVSLDRPVSLALDLSRERFFDAVRQALPRPAAAAPLGPAARALASSKVTLTAPLGRCAITISDYNGLAVGDILVLDHAVGDALPLAVNGRRAPRGGCSIIPGDTNVALKITEIPSA